MKKTALYFILILSALLFSGCGAKPQAVVQEELAELSLSDNYRYDVLEALEAKHKVNQNGCLIRELKVGKPQKSYTNNFWGLTVYYEGSVSYQVHCPAFARINPRLANSYHRKVYHIYQAGGVYFYSN